MIINVTWPVSAGDTFEQEEGILVDIHRTTDNWLFLILKNDGQFVERTSEKCRGELRHGDFKIFQELT